MELHVNSSAALVNFSSSGLPSAALFTTWVEDSLGKREVFWLSSESRKGFYMKSSIRKENAAGLTWSFTKLAFQPPHYKPPPHLSLGTCALHGNQWYSYLYANFHGTKGEYSDIGESHPQCLVKHNTNRKTKNNTDTCSDRKKNGVDDLKFWQYSIFLYLLSKT